MPTPDVLAASGVADRILIGKRTGFAFYRDHRIERKILIGVFARNDDLNTWFDGPFDQLPDNFIEGDTLRDAILEIEPRLRGKIDRYGAAPDGRVRYAIAPYLQYRAERDLAPMHRCAKNRTRSARYYACFSADRPAGRDGSRQRGPGIKHGSGVR